MPQVRQIIDVTEPTMLGGVWTLAAFHWRQTHVLSRHEIEDAYLSLAGWKLQIETAARCAFEDWLDQMPEVEKVNERLTFSMKDDLLSDNFLCLAKASGWFALSDDEAKTERMLGLVNCDKIPGMDDLFWRGSETQSSPRSMADILRAQAQPVCVDDNIGATEFSDAHRSALLLRPGSSDNDSNPAYRLYGRLINL